MTSNLGSDVIQAMAEAEYDEMKSAVMDIVTGHFRPEFVNRIDEAVVFHQLARAQIRATARIQLDHLRRRLEEQSIELRVSETALECLGWKNRFTSWHSS